MLARARRLEARVLPHGWIDVFRQIALLVGAYFAYGLVRGLVEGRATAAFQHARELVHLERTLHFFVEPSVQAWASGSHVVMEVSSWLYVNAQGPITIAALLFLYFRRNSSFYFVRNMLLVAMGLALIGYLVFPTAPPRFLPEQGFIDTVERLTPVKISEKGGFMNVLFNEYAAVPSMHVAFALMIGWPVARLVRSSAARVVWLVYPLIMVFVIVVTANHFIVDALLGAVTAGISAYAARWLGRARPAAWRFGSVRPRAHASA
jgi:hypothetical protein